MHLLSPTLSKCMCRSYINLMKPIKMSAARSDLSSEAPFFQRDNSVTEQHMHIGCEIVRSDLSIDCPSADIESCEGVN